MDSTMASPAAATPAASAPPTAAAAAGATSAITSIAALLPAPAHPPPKRTDTVALKLRLAELLDPDHGHLYWTGLGDFVAARINRTEWDDVLRRAFGPDQAVRDQAFKLHNALLLSILYNTTRPFLPPSSVRHSGFHPRGAKKRGAAGMTGGGGGGDADGLASAADDKRRRLLRDKVMSLGRRERAEVKLLGSATAAAAAAAAAAAVAHKGKLAKEGADAEERRRRRLAEGDPLGEAVGAASRGGGARVDLDGVPRALRERERQGVTLPATLAQDYGRFVQIPLCCESRMLPDAETMRERMLALAYEEGMPDGVEARSAALVQGAIEHHLRNMIASVISLVRGIRPASPPPLPRTAASSAVSTPVPPSTSTFAPAGAAPSAPSTAAAVEPESPSPADLPERSPLTIADFHALFAISPSLLGQHPTSAAVERMYAIAPPGSESDSDDCSSDDGNADDERDAKATAAAAAAASARARAKAPARDAEGDTPMLGAAAAGPSAPTGQGAGKHPRLSRSRASSFYGATRPVRASTGGGSPAVAAPSASSSSSLAAAATHARPLAPGAGLGVGASKTQRFVLDPSSTHGVPSGHPDVPPLRPTPAPLLPAHLGGPGAAGAAAGGAGSAGAHGAAGGHAHAHAHGHGHGAAGAAASGVLSPKSLALRNSLFPELAPSAPGSGSATPGAGGTGASAAGASGGEGDGNGTSTDAGSDSEDDVGASASARAKQGVGAARNPGFKIKLGSSALGGAAAQQQGAGAGASRPMPTNERDKEAGRKLWEVVDSVGLLDGVLQ